MGPMLCVVFFAIWRPTVRQEKRAQRLTFGSGDRPVGWGSSTRRGGGRKVRALPRKFFFLGFRREESGMSQEFCRDVLDSWGCSKSCAKKVRAHFSFPIQRIQCCLLGPIVRCLSWSGWNHFCLGGSLQRVSLQWRSLCLIGLVVRCLGPSFLWLGGGGWPGVERGGVANVAYFLSFFLC